MMEVGTNFYDFFTLKNLFGYTHMENEQGFEILITLLLYYVVLI